MGLLANSTSGLGNVSVSGLRRVPKPISSITIYSSILPFYLTLPPTRISAFMSRDEEKRKKKEKKQLVK